MAIGMIDDSTLYDIGDAIREKNGSTIEYLPSEMPEAIRSIEAGGVELPTLTNPGDAGDLVEGVELIGVNGNVVTGTIPKKTSSNVTVSGATVSVPAGYYESAVSKSVSTATQATPSISVDTAGKITASVTQTAGYVSAGTQTATQQLATQAAQTITPGTSNKTIASGRYLTGTQTIQGDANLVSANIKKGVSIFGVAGSHECEEGFTLPTLTNPGDAGDLLEGVQLIGQDGSIVNGKIPKKTSSNITVSGAMMTVPAGYYAEDVSKTIPDGKVDSISISVEEDTGKIKASVFKTAGYITSGSVTTTKTLTTQAAQTIIPSTSDQAISSGKYLTGIQTIKGDPNLIAENIKDGVTIFNVTGSYDASGGMYCWRKYKVNNNYEITQENLGTTKPSDCGSANYTGYTITDDGYFQLASGSAYLNYYHLPIDATNGKTKYVYYEKWMYSGGNTFTKLTLSDTCTQEMGDFLGYVTSDDANAHISDGIDTDGYWYVSLDAEQQTGGE